MNLTKMVNGKVVECSEEEAAEIQAYWKQNDDLTAKNADYMQETEKLTQKYPDMLRAIDFLYQKLGI